MFTIIVINLISIFANIKFYLIENVVQQNQTYLYCLEQKKIFKNILIIL